jgi:hypothetical protein
MNAIRTINLTKQVLLVSFVFFLSCKKQTEVSSPPQKSLSENAFFSRAKISANQSDRDLVDTIIDFCKRADDISHFSKVVMEKYGHPKWDLTLTLNNENGLKSLMVPVVDTSNQVKLIIFAYQDTKDHVIFKFVGRSTPQPGLPLSTNSGKTLTKESLVGIFNALDKRVMASKIQLNSSMENVKANNTYISSLCWLITWHYDDGSVGVLNPQCSYQIIITPGNAKGGLAAGQIGVVEDIQIGDSGGGWEQDPGEDCSVLSARIINEALKFTVVNRIQNINTISETNETRQREYKWEICKAENGTWSLTSIEKGVHKKTQNTDPNLRWKWVSLEHQSIGREGFVFGADIEFSERSKLIELGEYVSLIKLGVNVKVSVICKGFPISSEKNINSILIVHANG